MSLVPAATPPPYACSAGLYSHDVRALLERVAVRCESAHAVAHAARAAAREPDAVRAAVGAHLRARQLRLLHRRVCIA